MNRDFNFCKGNKFNMTSFVKAPYDLIFGEKYAGISGLAKLLLIAMLARFELSAKNGWTDAEGNTYIILSHKEATEHLSCSESKIKKIFSELAAKNIIKTKKQGLGKPNLIYINADLFFESSKEDSQESFDTPLLTDAEKPSEKSQENFQDSLEKTSKYNNNKYIKNNYINHINQSQEQDAEEEIEERQEYKELIKDLIAYDYLVDNNYSSRVLNCIVDALVNMLCTKSPTVRIGKRDIPYNEVKMRIYRINVNIVESLYESLKEIRHTVHNPTNYLITAIYNSLDSECMGFAG